MRTPPRLLPALVTPFTGTGTLDLEAHQHNLASLTELGIKGFLIGGSTGEGPYLEPGEREALLEATREQLGIRSFLLAGIAGESLRQATEQVEEAAAAGADAVLALTPTSLIRGNHTTVAGFFNDLADTAPIPVFLYSVPAVSGYSLPIEWAVRLSRHPNIVGIKDSGGDPVAMARLVEETSDGFVLFTGSSRAVTLCLVAGAYGAITASSNYLPEMVLDVVNRARRSPSSAREAQTRLTTVSTTVEAHRIPGVKAAAELVGLRPGYPRKPLRRLPATDRKAIAGLLGEAGVL